MSDRETRFRQPLDGPPAAEGGRPAFPGGLPLVQPSVPDSEGLAADLARILESKILTNGPHVRELEHRAATYLRVPHCVAVSNCTMGLMLLLRAAGVEGEVVVPSFTFAATVHAVAWCGLRPVFADVDPETLTLSPTAVTRAAGPRTGAVMGTHTYGTPCDVEGLAEVARDLDVPLFFDAAHAFGSRHRGIAMGGFGTAEAFSLSPTKVLVAGEGGIVATGDPGLAEQCRIGRNYGNPGDYDSRFVGLNGRMSELHAALALRSLDGLDARIDRRNRLAEAYRAALGGVPGLSYPQVRAGDRSTFKDFTVLVDGSRFGMDVVTLSRALEAEGIETRRYYAPPVHLHRAYDHLPAPGPLPVTEGAAARALTLPMWTEMAVDHVWRAAEAVRRIHEHATGDS
jgi:dTDP-4-amino-4,6-dideoxygalactose transaminase